MKKIFAMVLAAILLLAALLTTAFAQPEEPTKEEQIIQEAKRVYYSSKATAGKDSFAGFCGLMTSHQLLHMGINDVLETYDGNKQFDAYAAKERTTGGHYIKAYSVEDYTLEQALNTITHGGNRDAYNILVGFQWTNTASGNRYGHACVINAIVDGTVYFVESFYTSLGGPEGNVIRCSIEEFANYFEDWTTFEGVIHFGTKRYADSCQTFGTDAFVRARFDSTLRSEPCLLTENDCTRLRSVAAGELLRTTAVCRNTRGELYYYIEDGEYTGYVIANAVSVVRLNPEALSLSQFSMPETAEQGADFSLKGVVRGGNSSVGTVEICVCDNQGNNFIQEWVQVDNYCYDLEALNEALAFAELPEGSYWLTVGAEAACVTVKGTGLATKYAFTELIKQSFTVGQAGNIAETSPASEEVRNGWFWEGETWYLYKNGEPCTGWVNELGLDYYLREDGSVTVGWAEIDGQMRYFSATGAMCTGWLTTADGVYYRLQDGTAATLWQDIENRRYYFAEDGLLITQGTLSDGQTTYEIQPDGRAVEITA